MYCVNTTSTTRTPSKIALAARENQTKGEIGAKGFRIQWRWRNALLWLAPWLPVRHRRTRFRFDFLQFPAHFANPAAVQFSLTNAVLTADTRSLSVHRNSYSRMRRTEHYQHELSTQFGLFRRNPQTAIAQTRSRDHVFSNCVTKESQNQYLAWFSASGKKSTAEVSNENEREDEKRALGRGWSPFSEARIQQCALKSPFSATTLYTRQTRKWSWRGRCSPLIPFRWKSSPANFSSLPPWSTVEMARGSGGMSWILPRGEFWGGARHRGRQGCSEWLSVPDRGFGEGATGRTRTHEIPHPTARFRYPLPHWGMRALCCPWLACPGPFQPGLGSDECGWQSSVTPWHSWWKAMLETNGYTIPWEHVYDINVNNNIKIYIFFVHITFISFVLFQWL